MIKLFSMAVLVAMLAVGTLAHGTDKHVMGVDYIYTVRGVGYRFADTD